MYPKDLVRLVPNVSHRAQVFVAMSFRDDFSRRFEDVIKPAVEGLTWNETPLTAHRVDRTRISDSILVEVIDGIRRDLFVFVDISTMGILEGMPVRNGNVLYELGLAHALRRAEHVLIFRSDQDPLLFDVSGVRVHQYSPDTDPEAAVKSVRSVLIESANAASRLYRLSVEHTAEVLDPLALVTLWRIMGFPALTKQIDDVKELSRNTLFQATFHRLLDLGVIRTKYERVMSPTTERVPDFDEYTRFVATDLGKDVGLFAFENIGAWEAFAPQMDDEFRATRDCWLAEWNRDLLTPLRIEGDADSKPTA